MKSLVLASLLAVCLAGCQAPAPAPAPFTFFGKVTAVASLHTSNPADPCGLALTHNSGTVFIIVINEANRWDRKTISHLHTVRSVLDLRGKYVTVLVQPRDGHYIALSVVER